MGLAAFIEFLTSHRVFYFPKLGGPPVYELSDDQGYHHDRLSESYQVMGLLAVFQVGCGVLAAFVENFHRVFYSTVSAPDRQWVLCTI